MGQAADSSTEEQDQLPLGEWVRHEQPLLYWGIRAITRILSIVGRVLYGVRVEGLGNIPKQGPYILIFNELNQIGTAFIMVLISRLILLGIIEDIVPFGAEEVWTVIPGLARRGGMLPVQYGRGMSAPVLLAGLQGIRAGKVVVINPSGDLCWDGRMSVPHSGTVWLALKSGVPLVPVVSTQGAYEVWPVWADRPHLTGRFEVRVGKPFTLSDGPCNDIDEGLLWAGRRRVHEELTTLTYDGSILMPRPFPEVECPKTDQEQLV